MKQCNGIGLFLSSLWDTSETLSLMTYASGSIGFAETSWLLGTWLPHQQLGSPILACAFAGKNYLSLLLLATCEAQVDIQVHQVPLRQFKRGRGN